MSAFDLIDYYTPLYRWEQREKVKWLREPLSAEVIEEEYLRSITEERIFAGRTGNVAVLKHDRYRRIFEHTHDFFELIYIARGESRNRIENETMVLTEGNFCLIAPGVRHTIGVFSDEGIVMNIIIRKSTFDQTFSRLLDGANPLSTFFLRSIHSSTESNYILFRTKRTEQLYATVNRMAEESLRQDAFSPIILENLTSMLFCLLMREGASFLDESPARHPVAADAAEILSCIHELGVSVTLNEVAARFNYSESYISALIRKVTGMTFTEIVSQIRIRRAKALLITTKLSVTEIARQSGFPSVEHFCRTFRRTVGQTPTGYRSGVGK